MNAEEDLKPTTNELSALTRIFSSTVIQTLAKRGRSALFTRLLDQTSIKARCPLEATVADAFDSAFSILKKSGYRDEYVYRAAIVHKVLLGKHSLRTASMLREFRAGTCKADLVILNGTATAYEIKSERDSLSRLSNQIKNYQKIFSKVNVIASTNHVEDIKNTIPEEVGIMSLTPRYSISSIRNARETSEHLCPISILESIRSKEAYEILQAFGISVPKVPNTQRHDVLREIFSNLEVESLHGEMVRVLKKSRSQEALSDFVRKLPKSLHAAALSVPMRSTDHARLVDTMKTPLRVAMTWG